MEDEDGGRGRRVGREKCRRAMSRRETTSMRTTTTTTTTMTMDAPAPETPPRRLGRRRAIEDDGREDEDEDGTSRDADGKSRGACATEEETMSTNTTNTTNATNRERGERRRGGTRRANDATMTTTTTTTIEREDGYVDERARGAIEDAREEEAVYARRREEGRRSRARRADASAQTTERLRLDASAATEAEETRARGVQVDETSRGEGEDGRADARGGGRLRIRTAAVRATESALRERERLEFSLKYRGLRPLRRKNEGEDGGGRECGGDARVTTIATLTHARTKGLNASCVSRQPRRDGLTCVAYGDFSFEGAIREKGAVEFWSARTDAPVSVVGFDSGVLSVDWSTTNPNLLAVGCYGGEVIVLDVDEFLRADDAASNRGRFIADEFKHSDPVWAVRWIPSRTTSDAPSTRADEFVTAATDGKVVLWELRDTLLHGSEVLSVRWSPLGETTHSTHETSRGRDDEIIGHSGVMCLDFASHGKWYVIGTEEGKVHKCSLSYSDQYVSSYAPHIGPVYGVKVNPYSERVFATCSADWTIRVFLDDARAGGESDDEDDIFASFDDSCARLQSRVEIQPRHVIEYGQQPVNALAWSPWCSTEFAAVTDAGTLEIWDLASSVVVPKCELQITDDSRPASSVTYAHDAPVIFVGCANGTTHVLRMHWRDPTEGVAPKETQQKSLEDVLDATRHAV